MLLALAWWIDAAQAKGEGADRDTAFGLVEDVTWVLTTINTTMEDAHNDVDEAADESEEEDAQPKPTTRKRGRAASGRGRKRAKHS